MFGQWVGSVKKQKQKKTKTKKKQKNKQTNKKQKSNNNKQITNTKPNGSRDMAIFTNCHVCGTGIASADEKWHLTIIWLDLVIFNVHITVYQSIRHVHRFCLGVAFENEKWHLASTVARSCRYQSVCEKNIRGFLMVQELCPCSPTVCRQVHKLSSNGSITFFGRTDGQIDYRTLFESRP